MVPARPASVVDEAVAEQEDRVIGGGGGAVRKWSVGQRHTVAVVALGALVLGMCIGGALNHRATTGRWGVYV